MAWTPAQLSNCVLYMPTSNLSRMFTAGVTPATAAGDEILSVNTQGSGGLVLTAPDPGNRPFLRTDATRLGSLDFLNSTAFRYLSADDAAKAALKSFHASGTGCILFWVKFANAAAAANEYLMDCRNATSIGTYGFSVLRPTTERIIFSVAANGAILTLTSLTSIADTNWHSVQIRANVGAGATTMELDNDGSPVTGTLGTLVDLPCTDNLRIGATSTGALSTPTAQISELVITSGTLTDGEIDQWLAYNPAISDFAVTSVPSSSRIRLGLGVGL
jgi:hypothetical protein